MVGPGGDEQGFEMAEGEDVAEEKLVSGEGDAGDDERQGEGNGIVKGQGFETGDFLFVARDAAGRCGGGVAAYAAAVGVKAFDVDDLHQPVGEGDVAHGHFDVFFKRVFACDAARLTKHNVQEGLQFPRVDRLCGLLKLGSAEFEEVGEEVGAVEEEVVL